MLNYYIYSGYLFLKKHYKWLFIALCLILIALFFTPYQTRELPKHEPFPNQIFYASGFWSLVCFLPACKDLVFYCLGQYQYQIPLSIIFLLAIIFVVVAIFHKKKTLMIAISLACEITSLILMPFAYNSRTFFEDSWKEPNGIGFFLLIAVAVIQFIAILIHLWYSKRPVSKPKYHKPTKAERIAILEQRLSELEQKEKTDE